MIITILATFLSAVAYRMGGMSREKFGKTFPNFPMFLHEKFTRRFGCMLLSAIWLIGVIGLDVNWIAFLISMGITYGMLTTYHDYLNNGKEDWKCWLMSGACYSLALLPLVITGYIGLWGFLTRTVVLAIATMVWSEVFSNADIEEYGRGGLFLASMFLLIL